MRSLTGAVLVSALVLSSIFLLAFSVPSAAGESLGSSWMSGPTLQAGVGQESCLVVSDFGSLYCIGGYNGQGSYQTQVQYVSFPLQTGSWSTATSYPSAVADQSCVSFTVYIYCVGGFDGSLKTEFTAYSQPTANGTTSWIPTTDYPNATELLSCVPYSLFIYCVGGYTGVSDVNSTFFTEPAGSGGINTWTSTTPYPMDMADGSCVVYSADIYCVGGVTSGATGSSAVYYAPLSSSGIGQWTNTTAYPTPVYAERCVQWQGYIYCVGGYSKSSYSSAVYYSQVLPSGGLGPWVSGTPYPAASVDGSCALYSGTLACVGGFSGNSWTDTLYFNTISPPAPVTVTTTQTVTATTKVTPATTTSTVTSVSMTTSVTTTTATTTVPTTLSRTVTSTVTSTKTTSTTVSYTATVTATNETTTTLTQTTTVQVSQPLMTVLPLVAVGVCLGAAVGAGAMFLRRRERRPGRPEHQQKR